MSEEQGVGCTRPAAAKAETGAQAEVQAAPTQPVKEARMVHVGQKAPDFSAPGYQKGEFLTDVKLSDYAGKWLLLCFYPGDFTFV